MTASDTSRAGLGGDDASRAVADPAERRARADTGVPLLKCSIRDAWSAVKAAFHPGRSGTPPSVAAAAAHRKRVCVRVRALPPRHRHGVPARRPDVLTWNCAELAAHYSAR